jgi:uncharacterized protein YxeA
MKKLIISLIIILVLIIGTVLIMKRPKYYIDSKFPEIDNLQIVTKGEKDENWINVAKSAVSNFKI